MHISDKIMVKVAHREEENNNFKRCLDTLTCPKCGANLKKRGIGGENLIEIEYTCTEECQFKHERLES